jgi:oxygen-independent coproporphyrinogen-3 oxidase
LYVHVPFCEMRCGFCNLFTTVNTDRALEDRYIDALERQARAVAGLFKTARFAQVTLGGGTPTWLTAAQLERVFLLLSSSFAITDAPIAIETSPQTATRERLEVLRAHRVQRVSIGVQSFFLDETKALGRPQAPGMVDRALDNIRAQHFEMLNIDLIYGMDGQSTESWLASIRRALQYKPEQLYLYPLYVRPLTGMSKSLKQWDDERLLRYKEGRDLLLSEGYEQHSMRMFARKLAAATAPELSDQTYACQRDGMLGLGCGARSYTRSVHYSEEWAVASKSVRDILGAYINRSESEFSAARYGFELSLEEQQRRYILLTLLSRDGLFDRDFYEYFHCSLESMSAELAPLVERGWLRREPHRWSLTPLGMSLSDAIGPALFSSHVRQLMAEFSLR